MPPRSVLQPLPRIFDGKVQIWSLKCHIWYEFPEI
jgi:hypothetical protein